MPAIDHGVLAGKSVPRLRRCVPRTGGQTLATGRPGDSQHLGMSTIGVDDASRRKRSSRGRRRGGGYSRRGTPPFTHSERKGRQSFQGHAPREPMRKGGDLILHSVMLPFYTVTTDTPASSVRLFSLHLLYHVHIRLSQDRVHASSR